MASRTEADIGCVSATNSAECRCRAGICWRYLAAAKCLICSKAGNNHCLNMEQLLLKKALWEGQHWWGMMVTLICLWHSTEWKKEQPCEVLMILSLACVFVQLSRTCEGSITWMGIGQLTSAGHCRWRARCFTMTVAPRVMWPQSSSTPGVLPQNPSSLRWEAVPSAADTLLSLCTVEVCWEKLEMWILRGCGPSS